MGGEIAVDYSLGMCEVALWSRTASSLERAAHRAHNLLGTLEGLGIADPDRIAQAQVKLSFTADLGQACHGTALVVECVREDFDVKAEVLRQVGVLAPAAVVASNTSSLGISDLGLASALGGRFLGTHYWNPPTLMPLVEVVVGRETDERVVAAVLALLRDIGKEPAVVPDIPGFVWNRLQFALLREAARLVQQEGVPATVIDLIVRRGLGRRWALVGPFETVELGGVNTFVTVARQLFAELQAADVDPEVLRLIVDQRPAVARPELIRRRDEGLAAALRAEAMEESHWNQ